MEELEEEMQCPGEGGNHTLHLYIEEVSCHRSFSKLGNLTLIQTWCLTRANFSIFCQKNRINQASFDHVKVGPTPILALHNL